jgi:hypothetical protein
MYIQTSDTLEEQSEIKMTFILISDNAVSVCCDGVEEQLLLYIWLVDLRKIM